MGRLINLQAGALGLFFFLSVVIIGFSLLLLFSKNFVHSAVYLAGALISFAGLYALLSATFVALLQIFVYAGAVTIMVIFVIMMTRVGVGRWEELLQKQSAVAGLVVAAVAMGLVSAIASASSLYGKIKFGGNSTVELAQVLFRKHVVEFELASIILLVALIAAIYLAKEAAE